MRVPSNPHLIYNLLYPVVGVVFLSAVLYSGLRIPLERRVVFQECQPKDIAYHSWDPYCVGVVQTSFLLTRGCAFHIIKSRDSLMTGYGLRVSAPSDTCGPNHRVAWKEGGIEISVLGTSNVNSGEYRLFVGKELFTGGH